MTRFRRAVLAGERLTGLWLSLGSDLAAEVCAGAGYDWLLIDGEHAPNDSRSILAQLRAVEAHTSAVVRPQSGAAAHVAPLLDIGVRNLLVPMIDNADQAHALVRAAHYPPVGVRGMASSLTRASHFGRIADTADDHICLVAQIETPAAVAAAEEIATVEGIDALFVGLYDLCATMGFTGHPEHATVLAALNQVVRVAGDAGKTVGTFAPTPQLAHLVAQAGCTFIAYGSDIGLLASASSELAHRSPATAPPTPRRPG